MTFRLGWFCLMFGLAVTGCKTAEVHPQASVPLKIMSYNIRVGKGGGEWNNDPSQVDLTPVLRMIARQDPDIIGLQEVDRFRKRTALNDQPAEIALRLRVNAAFQPAYSVTVPGSPDEEYGNALFSRFIIQNSARIPLFKPDYSRTNPSYPDYYSEQRALLHGEVLIRGKKVQVFVTHLGLTADQREKQIKQILATVRECPGPKIIMGDFNAEPTEPAMQLLAQEYTDVLTAVNTPPGDRRSYPAGLEPKAAIDYIFVSKDFEVLDAKVIQDEALASDHNPVIAEVRLR